MSLKGLGRGLDALLQADAQAEDMDIRTSQILSLPVDALVPNPWQPRKTMSPESLEELARSIALQGVVQPLLVRRTGEAGRYQIVAGERRWRAAKLARLREVPVYLKELTDSEVMVLALIENLQREDLNPVEEARALQALRDRLSLTQEELAAKLCASRSQVANSLRLLQLPEKALERLADGSLSPGQARALLALSAVPADQEAFLAHILSVRPSVRECEQIAADWKQGRPLPWQTAPKDPVPGRPRRRKDPAFRRMEKDLSGLLHCRARFSGSLDAGRVSFLYRNREELGALMERLGVEASSLREGRPENPEEKA